MHLELQADSKQNRPAISDRAAPLLTHSWYPFPPGFESTFAGMDLPGVAIRTVLRSVFSCWFE
jgi:hypothetical protein